MNCETINEVINNVLFSCYNFEFNKNEIIQQEMETALVYKSNLEFINGHLTEDNININEGIQHINNLIQKQNERISLQFKDNNDNDNDNK
jgi:hypothetical protein